MISVHKENFTIKSYEACATGELSLNSLFHFLQEAASNHAHKLNVGFSHMREMNLFWVLSRIKIEIENIPKWGDTIEIETWPKGVEKLFALRDFIVRDINGNVLILATSSWLVVDTFKYKLHRIDELGVPIPDNNGKYALNEVADKIKPILGINTELEHKIYYNELDYNLHVNNSNYPAWLLNFYSPIDLTEHKLKTIQLNFLEEARFGDELKLIRTVDGDNNKHHFFEGYKISDKAKVFQAQIVWQ